MIELIFYREHRREKEDLADATSNVLLNINATTVNPEVHRFHGTEENRKEVSKAWEKALTNSDLAPIDVHTPLWLWSRAGFPPLLIV